jgi:hypothetical protein
VYRIAHFGRQKEHHEKAPNPWKLEYLHLIVTTCMWGDPGQHGLPVGEREEQSYLCYSKYQRLPPLRHCLMAPQRAYLAIFLYAPHPARSLPVPHIHGGSQATGTAFRYGMVDMRPMQWLHGRTGDGREAARARFVTLRAPAVPTTL